VLFVLTGFLNSRIANSAERGVNINAVCNKAGVKICFFCKGEGVKSAQSCNKGGVKIRILCKGLGGKPRQIEDSSLL
jgi:hypothetical protein